MIYEGKSNTANNYWLPAGLVQEWKPMEERLLHKNTVGPCPTETTHYYGAIGQIFCAQ